MSDPIPQSASGQPSGQGGSLSLEQPSGTPVGEPQQQASQQEADKTPISRAEALKMQQETLRQAQSYADKGRVRVEKAVASTQAAIDQMRNLGQQVTPDQEKTLLETAARKAMTEPEAEPQAQPVQAGSGQPAAADPIMSEVLKMQKDAGVELFDTDPEVAKIVRNEGLAAYFKSVEAALAAKKARTSKQPNQPAAEGFHSAVSGSASEAPVSSAHEAWKKAYKKG